MAVEVINAEIKSNIASINKDIAELKKGMQKSSKETKKLSASFGTLAKASGIVFILNKAFEVFQDVMSKNQSLTDGFSTATTALSIAFNDLFKFIENNVGPITDTFKELFEDPAVKIRELGTAIKDGIVVRFNEALEVFGLVGKSLGQLVTGKFTEAFDTIKEAGKQSVDVFTGVDDSFEEVAETVTKYTKSVVDQAKAITATNKAAQLAAVEFARLNAQYLKDAEIQRQIRDDETKTFEERIEANKKLDKILQEQQDLQRAQVQTQIDAAQAQVNMNNSVENRIALGEAQNAMLELEETITGQLSEQKTNAVALDKELLETQNELRLSTMEGMALELEELKVSYEQKLEMARKAGEDTTALTELYGKQQTAIKDKYAKEEEDIEKAKVKMQADMATQGLQLVEQAAGEGTALAKAAAIAQATISGVQGVQNAFTSANANVGATAASFGAYPVTMAALAGGFAAMNIAKIASGGKPSSSTGATADVSTPAPQMMSGAFELGGGVAPEPVKAFVVTDEMTNSQDQLANIRRRATI